MNLSRHLYAIAGLITVLTAISISAPTLKVAPPAPGTSNVTVTNTLGNPVLVKDVRAISTTPVVITKSADIAVNDSLGYILMYTVPAGKRFVATDLSLATSLPLGQKCTGAHLQDNFAGEMSSWFLIPLFAQDDNFFQGAITGAHLVFPAGHQVYLMAPRTGTTGVGTILGTLNGYLEDAN